MNPRDHTRERRPNAGGTAGPSGTLLMSLDKGLSGGSTTSYHGNLDWIAIIRNS